MAWQEPTNPVGTYDPAYMTNLYGASWSTAWNTCIYGSPTQTGANVLSNCTGYAQGRMLRLWLLNHPEFNPSTEQSHPFTIFNLDAGQWKQIALNNGYTVLDEPRAGTVFVTGSHVGVIEKEVNGEWWVSESGYGNINPYQYGVGIYKDGSKWYAMHASIHEIIGFIVIPDFSPEPIGNRTGYDRRRRYRRK